MKWHVVSAMTAFPLAIKLAGNLFATPQQLNRLRLLQVQAVEGGVRHVSPETLNLLWVELKEDESIRIDLIQSYEGKPVVGGKWLQLSVSPEGVVAVASSTYRNIVTDPPTGYT